MISDIPVRQNIILREGKGVRPNYFFKSFLPSHFFPQFVFNGFTEKDEIPIYVHKHNSKLLIHSFIGDMRTAYSDRKLYNYHIIVNTSSPSPQKNNHNFSIRQVIIKISPILNNVSYSPGLVTIASNDNFINIYDNVYNPGLIALIIFNRHITSNFLSKQVNQGLNIPNNKQYLRIQQINDADLIEAMNKDYQNFQEYKINKSFYDV